MTNVTLIVGGTTFTFQDGDVHKISSSIQSMAEQNAVATSGPMGAYLYDYDGVTKTITLTGAFTTATVTRISGYTITGIGQQKAWIESLINGSQTEITFTSNYETISVSSSSSPTPPYKGAFANTKCIIQSFEVHEEQGNPNRLPFTLILMVGQRI